MATRVSTCRALAALVGLASLATASPARGQWPFPYHQSVVYGPQRTRGTYGPGMSFGEFGYRLNYGYAFGNPYGGLGSGGTLYGFGSRVGTGYGPGNGLVYSSAYNTPGTGPGFAGYYPPFAVYGSSNQNPAVFPFSARGYPGPGWGPPPQRYVPVRPYYVAPPPAAYVRPGPR